MAEDRVERRFSVECGVKISSHVAEPHTTCGSCRFNLLGGSCSYGSRCDECRGLDDKAWKAFADLKLRLWKKSLQHLKKKLPLNLTHDTCLDRPLLASLYCGEIIGGQGLR